MRYFFPKHTAVVAQFAVYTYALDKYTASVSIKLSSGVSSLFDTN